MENDITATLLAEEFIRYTNCSVFLTGKAGTGKTTFLKKLKANTKKEIIIAAPTGVAAINAGGITLHSLFQLPFKLFIPINRNEIETNLNYIYQDELIEGIHFSKEKLNLLTAIELLVIDEISMVRADVLDAINIILRHVRGIQDKPFGGVQVLFIGDLLQLPPIAKTAEKEILGRFYPSLFFFGSKVMAQNPPVTIELKHIYRQSDPRFIGLLNNIRNNTITKEDVAVLEKCYDESLASSIPDGYITLTTHIDQSETINQQKLDALPGDTYSLESFIGGSFNEKDLPVDKTISIKPGSQVMVLKNDKPDLQRFYNGKIGTVSKVLADDVWVTFPGENEFRLEKETWKNIEYRFDPTEAKIKEEVIGEFKQYPIRLAWSITIHKSQGLTFEKAIVDIGKSFAAGQVYVALSRVKSLDGLLLRSRINTSSLAMNPEVYDFLSFSFKSEEALTDLLVREKNKNLFDIITDLFSWAKILLFFTFHRNNLIKWKLDNNYKELKWEEEILATLTLQQDTALKFKKHLEKLYLDTPDNYGSFIVRIKDAVHYFISELKNKILPFVTAGLKNAKTHKYPKAYLNSLELLETKLISKITDLNNARIVAGWLAENPKEIIFEKIIELLKRSPDSTGIGQISLSKKAVPKSRQTAILFKAGKSIQEISKLRKLAVNTIETHLIDSIQTADLSISDILNDEKINRISTCLADSKYNINAVKSFLGSEYSFFEIRLVVKHLETLNSHRHTS